MVLIRARTAVATSALALLGVFAGCAEPAPTPTFSNAPEFASDEEAYAAAEKRYREYLATYNEVDFADPAADEPLAEFTTGPFRAEEVTALSKRHAEKARRSGDSKVVWFRATRTDRESFVEAVICKDVSAVQIVDEQGNSLVSPDRPDLSATKVTFVLAGDTPVIEESEGIEEAECVSE